MIPDGFLHELLSRVDIVDVVGRRVELKRSGANHMGLCPFHAEKSPSFSVNAAKQFYHCFGCGAHGDVIRFLMEHSGASFRDAVAELAQPLGMAVPDESLDPAAQQRALQARAHQATLTEVLQRAATHYRTQLKQHPKAVDYLKRRGLSGEVAARFALGYAPPGWRSLASGFARYDDPLLVDSGLVIAQGDDRDAEQKRYDRFRDRIMFPIRNVKGECIGFGGRVLGDEKPKYLNSPETPLFSKGRELYGLFEARTPIREAGYALVTEGYMDVVALAQSGFGNAVATLGTACTPEHVQKLLRFTDAVVFSFDGDAAGRRAARKALEGALPHAGDTRSIKFLFLPPEHDPDSFVRAHGSDAFARMVGDAMPLSRFLIDAASDGCDLGTSEGRAHMASNARPLWSALPDGVLKRQLLGELAELAQLDARDLLDLWQRANAREVQRSPGATPHPARHTPQGSGDLHPMPNDHAPRQARRSKSVPPPWPGPSRMPRGVPSARIDHAARLLLSHMDFMEHLSHEDHAVLCAQSAPHGPLFTWIEDLFHTTGPLPWAVLRERLRDHPCEDLALRVMTGAHAQTEGDLKELRLELRDLLNRMLVEDIKAEQSALIERAAHDPSALERYRALEQKRNALLGHPARKA